MYVSAEESHTAVEWKEQFLGHRIKSASLRFGQMHGVGYFLAKKSRPMAARSDTKKSFKNCKRERGSVLATYHKFLKEHEENKNGCRRLLTGFVHSVKSSS